MNGILFSHQKKEILCMTTWVNLACLMLSKISHTGKDKYCMISLPCGLLQKLNSEVEQAGDCQAGVEVWVKVVKGYKLLVIR